VAIRNANLYRSERWRRQVADSLREVAGLLSADVDLNQLLDAILTELEHTLPSDVAAIWLLNEDALCLAATHGYPSEVCILNLSPKTAPWLYQALSADEPTIRTSDAPPEPLGATLGFPSDYSAIATPLRAGERRLGLLTLSHHTAGRYGTASRAMTAAFASYAAVAIENTRLYQEAQEQAWISNVMLQVAQATQSLDSLAQVIETVVRLVPMLAGVDRCAVFLWDETGNRLTPASAHGLNAEEERRFKQSDITAPHTLERMRALRTYLIFETLSDQPWLRETVLPALGFDAVVLLPLLAQGEVMGVMFVDHYRADPTDLSSMGIVGVPQDEWLSIIQGIAHQTAAAIENTQLRQVQREEAYVTAALLQVAQATASLNDLDTILDTIVRIMPTLIGVEKCIIYLWNEERGEFRPAKAYGDFSETDNTLLTHRYAAGQFPLLDQVRGSQHLLVYPQRDAPREEGRSVLPATFQRDFACDYVVEDKPLLLVPLTVKGNTLGVMVVQESESCGGTREKRLEIITGVAEQAALAVQNDRLQKEMAKSERLEQELALARDIQLNLMPRRLPELPGWDMAALCRPARQVGGDFYDLFWLPDGRLGIVIADVADKGMPAALFMALTRTMVRAATQEAPTPAAAMDRVNALLIPDTQQGMFVTAFYGALSLETGELAYANAGHNPPFLLRHEPRSLERLEKGVIALGVLEEARQQDHEIEIRPGDYVILYTDGATEAFSTDSNAIFGEKRFRQAIRTADGKSAQATLEALTHTVDTFVDDTPPSDDLTLVVLRRLTRR
jgi:serine phosphatase RsbU (regulator of sigma subunit)